MFHFSAQRFQLQSHFFKNGHCSAVSQSDQPEKQMLRANEVMVETISLLPCKAQYLLRAWCEIHGESERNSTDIIFSHGQFNLTPAGPSLKLKMFIAHRCEAKERLSD